VLLLWAGSFVKIGPELVSVTLADWAEQHNVLLDLLERPAAEDERDLITSSTGTVPRLKAASRVQMSHLPIRLTFSLISRILILSTGFCSSAQERKQPTAPEKVATYSSGVHSIGELSLHKANSSDNGNMGSR